MPYDSTYLTFLIKSPSFSIYSSLSWMSFYFFSRSFCSLLILQFESSYYFLDLYIWRLRSNNSELQSSFFYFDSEDTEFNMTFNSLISLLRLTICIYFSPNLAYCWENTLSFCLKLIWSLFNSPYSSLTCFQDLLSSFSSEDFISLTLFSITSSKLDSNIFIKQLTYFSVFCGFS